MVTGGTAAAEAGAISKYLGAKGARFVGGLSRKAGKVSVATFAKVFAWPWPWSWARAAARAAARTTGGPGGVDPGASCHFT
ncbi:hypothetical protein [Streptomyces sp. NPDC051567]|uniref:hypothetical protein n=1 Tax=Streptomyces sp. NPDC051567 TaxID=3365660 RepID=UPI0037A961FE